MSREQCCDIHVDTMDVGSNTGKLCSVLLCICKVMFPSPQSVFWSTRCRTEGSVGIEVVDNFSNLLILGEC